MAPEPSAATPCVAATTAHDTGLDRCVTVLDSVSIVRISYTVTVPNRPIPMMTPDEKRTSCTSTSILNPAAGLLTSGSDHSSSTPRPYRVSRPLGTKHAETSEGLGHSSGGVMTTCRICAVGLVLGSSPGQSDTSLVLPSGVRVRTPVMLATSDKPPQSSPRHRVCSGTRVCAWCTVKVMHWLGLPNVRYVGDRPLKDFLLPWVVSSTELATTTASGDTNAAAHLYISALWDAMGMKRSSTSTKPQPWHSSRRFPPLESAMHRRRSTPRRAAATLAASMS